MLKRRKRERVPDITQQKICFGSAAQLQNSTAGDSIYKMLYAGGADMFDYLIQGAQCVDGTGEAPFRADVGIIGGRIEAVGNLSGLAAKQTVDAKG